MVEELTTQLPLCGTLVKYLLLLLLGGIIVIMVHLHHMMSGMSLVAIYKVTLVSIEREFDIDIPR